MKGSIWTEQMCMLQQTSSKHLSLGTGRLCVKDFPIIHANRGMYITIDAMPMDGVIGLSPARTGHNFIRTLKAQGQIDDAIVGFNYEPYGVPNLQSRVTFGYVAWEEIEWGEDGANYYSNLGQDKWGLMMDDFAYAGKDMT